MSTPEFYTFLTGTPEFYTFLTDFSEKRRQQRLEAYLAANVAGHDYAFDGPGVHVSGVGLDVFPEEAVHEVHAMLGDVRAIQDGEAVYTSTGGVYDWLTGLSW